MIFPRSLPGKAAPGGFSLLELLLVGVSLLLLLTLGMGAMRSMRSRAEQAQCLANLRQIGSALALYQSDHQNRFPKHWDGTSVWYGEQSLGAYLPAEQGGPYVCPSTSETNYSLKKNNYLYNYYLGEYGGRRVTSVVLPQPHLTWVVADGTGPNYMVSTVATEVNFAWKHGGRGSWLFADGHVKSVAPHEYQRSWIRFPMQ